jgi:predicted DNA-binding protein YlxM (UPF0122 family)
MEKKNYRQDNKTIKEKTRRELSIKLVEVASKYLTEREEEILGDILLDDKTFNEIGDRLQLTSARVKQIFEKGVRRMYHFLNTIEEKILRYDELSEQYSKMEKDLADLKKQVAVADKNKAIWKALLSKTRELLSTPIEDTTLSARIKNLCANGDVFGIIPVTVADLVKLSPSKLKTFRNCGKKSIDEIEDFLSDNGLKWGMLDSPGID